MNGVSTLSVKIISGGMNMEILQVSNLKKYYTSNDNIVKALDNVSFSVTSGTFIAIIGTSGSGKTTLLNQIGGLDKPTDGKVLVDGTDIYRLNEEERTIFRRRKIGFIFQNFNLIPTIPVKSNILLPVRMDGKKEDLDYFRKVVSLLGIEDQLNKMPNTLSGGQQQRVAIARALITKPSIILADEPTGNLDTKTSLDVLGLLRISSKEFHQTIIMITHNESISQMADKIIHIEDGKIIKGGNC